MQGRPLCFFLILTFIPPVSPMFSDTDSGSSMLVLSITIVEICLIAKTERDKQEYLYSKLSLFKLFCIVLSGLVTLLQWQQWCVLAPKGCTYFIRCLPRHGERERQNERSFNCGFRGFFVLFFYVVISPVVKIKPPGTLYYKWRSLQHLHSYFLLSLNSLLTVFSSSLAFIFSHLVQALYQLFSRVYPSSAFWFYPFHLSFQLLKSHYSSSVHNFLHSFRRRLQCCLA